jgi:hypothetical protein
MHNELIEDINQSLEISIPASASMDALKEKLSSHINYLINHDFEKLVYYLYRIDVDENKMRSLLHLAAGENAAGLIAELIIERQLQKMKHRKNESPGDKISDEEKW